jgi:hypothetical protein
MAGGVVGLGFTLFFGAVLCRGARRMPSEQTAVEPQRAARPTIRAAFRWAQVVATIFVLCGIGLAARGDEPPPCAPLTEDPLPPVALRPASKQTLAQSRRAAAEVIPDGDDCFVEKTLAKLRRAVRIEPANAPARIELADRLLSAVDREESLRGELIATLTALRDGSWAGCEACVGYLADSRKLWDVFERDDGKALGKSLQGGPPGPLGDATRAILDALDGQSDGTDSEGRWRAAARYLDGQPIRIADGFNGSGADVPEHSANTRTVVGHRGLSRWLERFDGIGAPGRGETMWCSRPCCAMPFFDRSPHMLRYSRLCFDARLHLRRLETDTASSP